MKFLAAILIILILPVCAWADRVALVIGNSDYQAVAPLDNPRNDSAAVSVLLEDQGFEVVRADNLNRVQMRETLRNFRAMADRSEIAMVYYAGHGIEIGGTNYLMPVDARLEDVRDAGLEMVEMDLILRQISGARRMKMVVLDACRNNPFLARMKQQGGTRSARQGLADVQTNESDTLIAYAAAAGEITPDGRTGGNSPFTAAFLDAMAGPPTDVRQLLGRVRDSMRQSVPGAAPFVYSSLGGGEYVINPESGTGRAAPEPQPSVPPPPTASISQDFIEADRAGSFEAWDAFLIKFEDQSTHPLYAFALEKREELRPANRTAISSDATAPAPRSEVIAALPATEEPQTPALANPEPAAEPEPEAAQNPEPEVEPEPEMTLEEATRLAQTRLKERGCYLGAIDGDFGRRSQAATAAFLKQAGMPLTDSYQDGVRGYQELVAAIEAKPGIACPKVARTSTPTRTTKPRTQTTTQRTTQAAKPAQTDDSDTNEVTGVPGFVTRKDATKMVPIRPSDCIGGRKKFYDCD